jgi:hypothetical protein
MYSLRNIFPSDAWRSPLYEFEDIIRQIDSVELLAPVPRGRFKFGNKIAKRVTRYSPIVLNPGISKASLIKNYEMMFVLCSIPWDLLAFSLDNGWKARCKTSICLLDEIWLKQISQQKYFLKILSQFDHVLICLSQSVKAIRELSGKECTFLPPAIDAIKFCPYPDPPKRVIDVYSIGRRSAATHRKLLEMAEARGLFYVYDSISGKKAINLKEHRQLFANMAGRSRFFLVNPGLIDDLGKRGDQRDIGNRYFEGAAAGCIMIGEVPEIEEFKELFDWPDAVICLPLGSDKIDAIIDELDKQPDREDVMHRNNIAQALRRHDWAYRWESLLKIAGLAPMPGLSRRKEQLEKLATSVEEGNLPQGRTA